MGAWDYCQRGFWHLNKLTATDGAAAYGLFKTAVALDPNLAEAHLGLARALIVQWEYGSIEEQCVRHESPPFRQRRSMVKIHTPNMCSPRQAIGLATSGPP